MAVPSLYDTAMVYTRNRIFEYLQDHVKSCPLENGSDEVQHADIEVASRCPTFLKARDILQSSVCTEVLVDLLERLSAYRMQTTQEMVHHAALPLLFNSQMTSFTIKNVKDSYLRWNHVRWNKLSIEPILNLLQGYGENIIELDILSAEIGYVDLFTECLEKMKSLKYLSFTVKQALSEMSDCYASAVGQSCSCLVYLNIRYWKATREGIQQLIYQDFPKNEVRNPCCESIRFLEVLKYAQVIQPEREEIVRVIFNNFPNLEIFPDDHSTCSCTAVPLMCRMKNKSFENITRLYCMPYPPTYVDTMATLSELCPNVTSFMLHPLDDNVMSNLHLFKKVTTLAIYSYNKNFEIYLEQCGKNITSLQIHGYSFLIEENVNLELIGNCCPNLEKLVLENIHYTFNENVDAHHLFVKLKTLYLLHDDYIPAFFDVGLLEYLMLTNIEELYVKVQQRYLREPPVSLYYPNIRHFCLETTDDSLTIMIFNYILNFVSRSPKLETFGCLGNFKQKILEKKLWQSVKAKTANAKLQFLTSNNREHYITGHPPHFKLSNRVINNTSIFAILEV